MLLSPLLRRRQTLSRHGSIPRHQLHLEVPGNRHQRRLELVVVHVVRVRRLVLARDDLVRAQEAQKSSVEESRRNELARAGARAGAEAEMGQADGLLLSGRVETLEPALGVEFAAVWAEVVDI
jgi:hypothetical protein